MGYGTAVKEARATYDRTQDDVARSVHISDSMLSDIERGKRQAAPDVMQALARELDDPRVYLQAQLLATGGVGSPFLDRVDRHRMAMAAKVREELQEVIEIFDRAEAVLINARGPEGLSPEGTADLKRLMIEMIEAKTCLKNTIAQYCLEFRFSMRQLYEEHRLKLVAAGYLRQEKDAYR